MTSIFFIDGLGSLDTQSRESSTIHANRGRGILEFGKQPIGSCVPFRSCSKPRKATVALAALAILSLLFGLTLADAAWRSRTVNHAASRALVRELGLSDLSLFTEARYTRHPSQADRHAP
ncbi:MAG: hypothetical protein JNJ76_08245, partial [Candidatus Competibacter sp.]|nr:hypothetical protein [Candidatus Competibacter sp.]